MNERLFSLADAQGIKLQHIADILGTKNSRVYDWKRGRSEPTSEELVIIAGLLNTSPAYLHGETDDPNLDTKKPAISEDDGLEAEFKRMLSGLTRDQKNLLASMMKEMLHEK